MRHIPTNDARVEELKKQAKRLQRKGGGKHADLLERVARGAGYDNWRHVTLCNKYHHGQDMRTLLLTECRQIAQAERDGTVKAVSLYHPATNIGPFVLFSSGIGDAWMLDPEAKLALCVMWHGQERVPHIVESAERIGIDWDGGYSLVGDFMRIETEDPEIGRRAVAGYPLDELRKMIDKAMSAERKMDAVFGQLDAVALSDDVIGQLVRRGWSEEELRKAAADGFVYSPSRNSILSPPMDSEDLDDDEPPERG